MTKTTALTLLATALALLITLDGMELETPDVGLGILCIFFQTTLELTVLLETVLLGHGLALLIGAHYTALALKFFDFAAEKGVLPEFTFQRSVEQWRLDGWLQTYLVKALLTVTQYPGLVAIKLVLQSFTYHAVGA